MTAEEASPSEVEAEILPLLLVEEDEASVKKAPAEEAPAGEEPICEEPKEVTPVSEAVAEEKVEEAEAAPAEEQLEVENTNTDAEPAAAEEAPAEAAEFDGNEATVLDDTEKAVIEEKEAGLALRPKTPEDEPIEQDAEVVKAGKKVVVSVLCFALSLFVRVVHLNSIVYAVCKGQKEKGQGAKGT